MVISRDWAEVSVLECILGALHIGVEVESQPVRASHRLVKSKVDALIVDRDLEGSANFLNGLKDGKSHQSVPLVIFSSSKRQEKSDHPAATFFFQKPISVEQAVHTLSAARTVILDCRLRYHRQPLEVPVTLRCGAKRKIEAKLLNISQGGMRMALTQPLPETPLTGLFYAPRQKGLFQAGCSSGMAGSSGSGWHKVYLSRGTGEARFAVVAGTEIFD